MAIDYIIGALQLLSISVNILALASFWVTPGLRTTANRFVINLLIVNIVGCLALTPALWLHGGLIPTVHIESKLIYDDDDGIRAPSSYVENDTVSAVNPTVLIEFISTKQFTDDVEFVAKIREYDQEIISNQTKQFNNNTRTPTKNIHYSDCTRFWGFDLVAALGGLSVMLVVGDTWCAITDPLRYHSRISGLKSWILIATTWFISILFCIASALRRDCRLITTEITSTLQKINWVSSTNILPTEEAKSIVANRTINMTGDAFDFNDIYDLIYSCTFFVVIILAPICLVCAMYWKIISEARQNGLRMRQNGSSPLLQSALNLATASAQMPAPAPAQLEHSFTVIGEEDSDLADSLNSSRSNVMHITLRRNSMAATLSPKHQVNINKTLKPIKTNQLHSSTHKITNFCQQRQYLEIPKFNEIQKCHLENSETNVVNFSCDDISSDESTDLKKSSKQFLNENQVIYNSLESTIVCNELRQVHSTPDLQKTINSEMLLISTGQHISINCSDKKIHSTGSIHKQTNITAQIPSRRPSICTPPKALSYMTSIRHRLSNASSIFKYREESRAARISILVVIMFLFSYFPYGLLVLLQGRATFYANSSFLGVLFLLIANISSPFIFAYRNRRVRRGVCRLFGVDAKTNERLQKQRMLMHGNLRANSCREPKRKTKIVRINRNSAKSASFSNSSHSQCKYAPIPLINKNISTENQNQCQESKEYDDQLQSDNCTNVVSTNQHDDQNNSIDICKMNHYDKEAVSQCEYNSIDHHVINMIPNCIDNNNFERNQSDADDFTVAKYVKDIVNDINCTNDNQKQLTSAPMSNQMNFFNNQNVNNDSVGKLNMNKTNNCNLTTTTGANVIKQKISLLRRVFHTHSSQNCSSPTNSCTANHIFSDSNNSIKPVNV